jgi:hypothetical protein
MLSQPVIFDCYSTNDIVFSGEQTVPKGICKLCLEYKDLQDSHLMPKSLYKKSRSPTLKNPHPAVLTAKGSRQSFRYRTTCFAPIASSASGSMARITSRAQWYSPTADFLCLSSWKTQARGSSARPSPFTRRLIVQQSTVTRSHTSRQVYSGARRSTYGVSKRVSSQPSPSGRAPVKSSGSSCWGLPPFPDRAYLTTIVCKDKKSYTKFL